MALPRRTALLAALGALSTLGIVGGWAVLFAPRAVQTAPAVDYTLLDGSRHNTRQLRGKVVLVNFWATSCTVCVHEMPQLAATHEKYRAQGLETLAVAMSYDPPAYVVQFAEQRRLPFGIAIDNTGAIARSFADVKGTPTTFVIDRRGDIVERYVGAPDFAALHRLIEKLLRQA